MIGGSFVIEAKKLTKKFGKLTAVNGIDFRIIKGECFGFLGLNGAGKTSTVKMIYCTSPKSGGSLSVLGKSIDLDPRNIKEHIGVVQQENNLDPDFTAFENLMVYSRYFSIPKDIAKNRTITLLKFLHLTEKRDTNIEDLSGGMKRRLMIARALLNEPEILILDEPTTGLDPQARHLIWDQIRSLKKRKITVILTTHYMEEAQQLCDRVVIMDDGKILVEGPPDELIREHGGGGEVLEIRDNKETLNSITDAIEKWPTAITIETDRVGDMLYIYSADCHAIENELVSQFHVRERLIRMANLEDVFLKLTGRGLRD